MMHLNIWLVLYMASGQTASSSPPWENLWCTIGWDPSAQYEDTTFATTWMMFYGTQAFSDCKLSTLSWLFSLQAFLKICQA